MGWRDRFKVNFGRSPLQSYARIPFGGDYTYSKNGASIPMEENAYDVVAKHFSKLSIRVYKENVSVYDNLYRLLNFKPNKRQTPTEFWNTFYYVLFKYKHSVIIPTYKGNVITELNVLDLSKFSLGFTYDEDGEKYLLLSKGDKNITLKYDEIIYQRLHPKTVMYNENCYDYSNDIPTIIDETLTTMLSELKSNFDLRGIVKVGEFDSGGINGVSNIEVSDEIKAAKLDSIISRVKNKLIVLDSGESFETIATDFKKSTMEEMEQLMSIYYSYLGIPEYIINNTWDYQQYSTFFNSTMLPLLKSLEEELNYKLVGFAKFKKGYKVTIIMSQMSGMSAKDKGKFLYDLTYMGTISRNEAREELGFDSRPGEDDLIGNKNMDMRGGESEDEE